MKPKNISWLFFLAFSTSLFFFVFVFSQPILASDYLFGNQIKGNLVGTFVNLPALENKEEVNAFYTPDSFAKLFEDNRVGAFINLALFNKIAIKGEIADITGSTASMNTGWISGRIDFEFPDFVSGLTKLRKGKEAIIVGSFFGYGLKESTLILDNCYVLDYPPTVKKIYKDLNNITFDHILAFYFKRSSRALTNIALEDVSTYTAMLQTAAGGIATALTGTKINLEYTLALAATRSGSLFFDTENKKDYATNFKKEREKMRSFIIYKKSIENSIAARNKILSVSAKVLQDDFESNYLSALSRYSFEYILVEGKISKITGIVNSKRVSSISLSTGYFRTLDALFFDDAIISLAEYKVGDNIKLLCKVLSQEEDILLYPAVAIK